ncbi:hypothetical protein K440DRAFT_631573 [Wilcoxina mikolae CBS 423.85]|nr:hypothetical protein K440DRAFT_631573 [Wilcoxina mikolae CBS 423.85]
MNRAPHCASAPLPLCPSSAFRTVSHFPSSSRQSALSPTCPPPETLERASRSSSPLTHP